MQLVGNIIMAALTASDSEIESAITETAKTLGYLSVKPEQIMVVSYAVRGRDVFAVLPTGFGKSLCFALLPGVYDRVCSSSKPAIVLVVTPLTAIIKDQVNDLQLIRYAVIRSCLLLLWR